MSDEEQWSVWMAAAQDGDGEAYQSLLEAVLPMLRAIAGRRFSDPQRVEDVVQEILLSVHRYRHTYDPKRPFGPWLRTIAARRVADALRSTYRRSENEVLVDEYPETFLADGTNNPLEGALSLATGDTLNRAIAKLSPGQRTAIELLKLKELSLKEASAQSGMSVGALKVALHRAMANLSDDMNDDMNSETTL